ncbi:MAG: hypothetical protein RLZZ301_1834 [Bacteroidota bacterium]|jgi:16S rRNA C967 or C1407 C5-methylase (RsmB/RsmF family)/NOL1/NOP2/fmu family ribosome biogenesis protein
MKPLPLDFCHRIENDPFNPQDLLTALDSQAPTSVRLHPKRQNRWANEARVAWNTDGRYLANRPAFTYDPLFHAGAYYPQEAASMYIRQALEQLELPADPICLDLCAAPGGKSTLLASWLNERGVLIANEIIRSRAYILSENLSKWGYANTFVCNHKIEDLPFEGLADLMLVDAPCSGEGMFRKDPDARDEWNLKNAETCATRQHDLLSHCWAFLKKDAYLLYSTCTFNPEENERQIARLLQEEDAEAVALPKFEGMKADRLNCGWYFFPGQTQSEGFYIAVLKKTSSAKNRKASKKQLVSKGLHELSPIISSSKDLQTWQSDNVMMASSAFATSVFAEFSQLNWLKTGVGIAEQTRKGLQWHHDLVYALDIALAIPSLELSKEQALRYLHGETFTLETPAGYYYLNYNSQRIGLIKHLGTRFNNAHPKEWRIRHLQAHHLND